MARFKGSLFEHQKQGVRFALAHPYHINGFEMGIGKTPTSLSLACHLDAKTLVVCPAFLRTNWIKEIEKFTEGLSIDVISYTQMAKMDSFDIYDLVIADEAHYLKNHKAKRTQKFHQLIKTMLPSHLMLMSGTAIKNRVSEFWSLLQLCHYGKQYPEFRPFNKLYYKFCNTFSYERTFEVNNIPIVRFDGVKNIAALKELIRPVYLRKRADDVLDLPESTEIYVQGKCSKTHEKNLKEAFERYEVNSKDAAYMSLKRANAQAKIKDTIKLAQEMLEQDEKVIVFSDHVDSAKEIGQALGFPVITGSVPADTRGQTVADYEAGLHKGISATIGSLSTGVTLVSGNKMIFNDVPFVPADLDQAKARIRRIGQKKPCFYYYIYNSEFDKSLMEMLRRKVRDINKVYR